MTKRLDLTLGLLLILLLAFVSQAAAQPKSKAGHAYSPDRIIVKFKQHVLPDDVDTGRVHGHESKKAKYRVHEDRRLATKSWRNDRLDYLKEHHGLTRTHVLKVPIGTDIEQMLSEYRSDPDVEYAEPDYVVEPAFIPNDTYFINYQWNLNNTGQTGGTVDADIDAPEAWDITTGSSSVVIAVVDTGVMSSHPDLSGKVLPGYDFVNNDSDASDDNGHGTHVAGIAAAKTNNSAGGAGVCGGCLILPVKVLNASGSGTDSGVANGIIYAVDNGADIINLSLIGVDSATKYNAIQYAYNSGRVIVAGTGNDGDETVYYPAGYSEAIAVGSTDHFDMGSFFSTHGYHIDVSAPGESILSALQTGGYGLLDGTSMATPHVAGLAGLILSRNPSYSPDQVRWHIELGADDYNSAGWDRYYGWGRINAFRSLQTISPGLTFSLEETYASSFIKGVSPSTGTGSTLFTYKVIYFDDNNWAPSYVQVCIDGNCSNMTGDTSAAPLLRDGNWANGEQYVYTTTLSQGSHIHYFTAFNGTYGKSLPTQSWPIVTDLAITTTALPSGTAGTSYSTTLSASGGTAPYTWSISSGSLPPGLTMNSSTGVISGVPSAIGTSNFTASVTDADSYVYSRALSITVNSAPADTTPPAVTAFPSGGTYISAQNVVLSADEPATIYYTTDGTTPTTSSQVFTTALIVNSSLTLKYFGRDAQGNSSAVQTQAYVITGGEARGWGWNGYGMLGDGTTVQRPTPVPVSGLSGVLAVSAGWSHSLALMIDGSVRAWGKGLEGQLGDGAKTDRYIPVNVSGLSGVIAVSGGMYHSLALKSDGTVWAWGSNNFGQLGNGTTTTSGTPVQVIGLSSVAAIAAGGSHSLALKNDGTVWAWGSNGYGQLGDGSNTQRLTPVQVSGLSGVISIAAGEGHSLAIRNDGTVWAWGMGGHGQLGSLPVSNKWFPAQVSGLGGALAVGGGRYHSIALKNDGTVWAWGLNDWGQLGDGTTTYTNRGTPSQVIGLTGVVKIATGGFHSIAMKNDSTVWSWGYNQYGQLGDGTTTMRLAPVQVSELSGMSGFMAGQWHSLALHIETVPPTGSVLINEGAATNSSSVTLTASCSDASGCAQMRFSDDGSTWSAWETYSTSKAWTLPAGDGTKAVYVQFKDGAGNISVSYSDTIIFDTTGPTGSVTINSGAPSTTSVNVILSLSCTDANGCAEMRFSDDGSAWSAWEAYSSAMAWTLPAGNGTKTVYAQFTDAAGNVSGTYSDAITLDATAISGLSATAVSSNRINLTWVDNTSTEDGFKIERKTGASGTYTQIATAGANATSFHDLQGLLANTAYFYRVKAYNGSGESAYSNEAFVATFGCSGCSGTSVKEVWNVAYDSGYVDSASDIAVDENGNVFVTGSSGNISDYNDYRTIRFDTNGNIVWNNVYDTGRSESGGGVAVDNNGYVYVTGYSYGGVHLIKYNTAGELVWARGGLEGADIAADGSGNVYVTGHGHSGSTTDAATAKFDSAGNRLWRLQYDSGGHDYARGIALDLIGNIYVVTAEYRLIKYDNSGNIVWNVTKNFSDSQNAYEIAIDGYGDIYVTGRTKVIKYNSDGVEIGNIDYGGDARGIAADSMGNVYVTGSLGTRKYDSNGVEVWRKADGGFASNIAVDGEGNIYITGTDFRTIKYQQSDVAITTASLPSGVRDMAYSQAMSAANGVWPYTWFIAGSLPPGLALDSSTGIISGIPTTFGTYDFTVYATDSEGFTASRNLSITVPDLNPPTGSVSINGGAVFTSSVSASLALTCTDAESGCSQMHLSSDGVTWSAWETYSTSKAWTLPAGDGTKTVYVQFADASGNISASYSDTVILDTTAPSGSIAINGGSPSTTAIAVTLNLSATDANGVAQMRLSNDGTSWTPWENYATSRSWNLIAEDGPKTVHVQYKDGAGNVSSSYAANITLLPDTVAPTGSVMINDGQISTNSKLVTLSLSASDNRGVSQMRFSNDDATWSPWEPFGVSKSWTMDFVPGIGTVYAQFMDPAGNVSSSYNDTIILRTIDLHFSSFSAPGSGSTGSNLSVLNTVMNQGTEVSTSSIVKFYISADAVIDTTDIYLGQRSVGSLAAGASNSATTSLKIPATVIPGSYYIGAIADGNNKNLESDEDNNTASQVITVTSGVDLAFSSFTALGSAATGTALSVSNTVKNNGIGMSASSYVKFYLSADAVIDATDRYLGQRSVSFLAAGATSVATSSVKIPAIVVPGNYYIGAIADANGTNPESDESNNTASQAITVTSGVDLTFSAFSAPVSGTTGFAVTVANTVKNNGIGMSASSYVKFYLSTDATIDATDIYLGQRSVSFLATGATSVATSSVKIPATVIPGSYYIGAIADANGTNPESDEANNTASQAITVSSGIDLTVTLSNGFYYGTTGSGISVTNTVQNYGTGTSAASYVKFYLSTDAVIGPEDRYLGQRYVGALAGGAASTQNMVVFIPVTVTPGNYYLGAVADATGTNPESGELNNTYSSEVIIDSGIDLVATSLSAPPSVVTGAGFSIGNTVQNQGLGTTAPSNVKFYLSADAVITTADIYLGQRSVGALAGGSVSFASNIVTIPAVVAPGSYYIGMIADATGTNIEGSEVNNTASQAITVLSGIDLAFSSFSAPATGTTGAAVAISNTVRNNGTGKTASSYVKFYLSTDAVIDAADIYLGQRSVSTLAGGATSAATTSVKIPATVTPGSYYIGVIADANGTNPESDEANNTASQAITISSGVDLAFSSFGAPANGTTGSSVSVANTVKNNGTGTSASSYVKFYLSTDAVIDASDIYLGQRSVGVLASGTTSSANTAVTIPVSVISGNYYIGAIADVTGTNPESDEANNTASQAITISSGVDLAFSSFSAPATGTTGAAVAISNTVRNNGTGKTASSYVKFYLSTDAVIDAADIYLGQRSVSTLAGGATSAATTSVKIPATVIPGSYYIGALADSNGTNPESDEGNNTSSQAITITSGVDLAFSSFGAPANGTTGSSVSVANTVKNNGTGTSASSYVKFYLSTDAVIDAADIYLGQRSVSTLAGGATSAATTSVKIPATVIPGSYYIGALADSNGTNPESDEGNNTSSQAITITSGVDLAFSSFGAPANGTTGSSVSVANTVKNNGTGTSASSYVKFYLSTDAVIDAADIYLGQRSVGALAGGATSAATTSVKIPATVIPGSYYIGAIADSNGTNPESDEGNNTAWAAVSVVSGVDLVFTSFNAPSSWTIGSSFPVANTVKNQGTGLTVTSYVKFYLSVDPVIDASDRYLGQRAVSSLAGGASSSKDTYVTIPGSVLPGFYYIGAIADATGTNYETDELNNTTNQHIELFP